MEARLSEGHLTAALSQQDIISLQEQEVKWLS
jgi:hypothetical protein